MSLPAPSPDATILITGASAGIGEEIARQLAAKGHGLTLVARRAERLEALARELTTQHGVEVAVDPCDLADVDARRALVERTLTAQRHLSGLVNNAGFGSFGKFWQLDLDTELEMVDTNVAALHHLTGAFLPGMVERGAGAVLNVASTASFQPLPGNATYAATKAFVLSFTEAVATELSGTGVSLSALCPGPVKTEFTAVADVERESDVLPDFAWLTASDTAAAGIDAMEKGKRSVVPGLGNKATMLGGRYTPRTILLPLVGKVYGGRFSR